MITKGPKINPFGFSFGCVPGTPIEAETHPRCKKDDRVLAENTHAQEGLVAPAADALWLSSHEPVSKYRNADDRTEGQ